MEEYFDVLDEFGNKISKTKARREVHRDGDWHKAVRIWILNDNGEILLQRRSKNKDSHPGMLDASCAGHLSAGDDSLSAARRELKEELGLEVNEGDLEFVKTIKCSSRPANDFINNEFDDIYILRTSKTVDSMKLQAEEVDEALYVPYDMFRRMVEERRPDLVRHEEDFEMLWELFDERA